MQIAQEQELMALVARSLPPVGRVLVFAPHPDDEIFGCGGALALLRAQGADITVIIVTDGALGGANSGGELPGVRADESRAAAAVMGLAEPVFWQLPDRGLVYGETLIARLCGAMKAAGADMVFLPAPTELHPDHQALAFAGAEAARRIGGAMWLAFYEISAPLPAPNLLLDISQVCADKQAAMRCFPSQLAEQPYDARIEGLNRFRSYFMGADITSAEAFLLVKATALAPGLAPLFEGPLARRRHLGFAAGGDDIPLVSIIIRSMDQPVLDDALASVALQIYPHIEVLVVNAKGGIHRELPEQCGPFPLRLLNQGGEALRRPVAANRGLQATLGRLISFLDDDDTILPNHIHQLVSTLQAASRGAVAYAGVQGRNRHEPEAPAITTFAEPAVSFPKLLLGNIIPIHAVLFPADLHEQGVCFDEALDCYEDWDFWLQMLQRAPFAFTQQITATYYLGGGSGVSPLAPDQTLVVRSLEKLYNKWGKQFTPELLAQIKEIYQQRSHDFVRREEELNCQLHQRNLQLAELDSQLHQRNLQLVERDSQLAALDSQLAAFDSQLRQSNLQLAELDSRLHQRNLQLIESQQLVEEKDAELHAIRQTLFYRVYARMARLIPGGTPLR